MGGGLFGPDALMRLAMDSRTRHLMDDKEFQTMLSGLMQNPSMIGAYMNDPRMQLVRHRSFFGGGGKGVQLALVGSAVPAGGWMIVCKHRLPSYSSHFPLPHFLCTYHTFVLSSHFCVVIAVINRPWR